MALIVKVCLVNGGRVNKYRIKMTSGRIIGPLILEQIKELFEKSYVEGEEECQIFPNGSWKSIKEFDEIKPFLKKIDKDRISVNSLDNEDIAEDTDNRTRVFSEIGKFREKYVSPKAEDNQSIIHANSENSSVVLQEKIDNNNKQTINETKKIKNVVKEYNYKERIERRMRGEKTDTTDLLLKDLNERNESPEKSLSTNATNSFVTSISDLASLNNQNTTTSTIAETSTEAYTSNSSCITTATQSSDINDIDADALDFEKNENLEKSSEKNNEEIVSATVIVNAKSVKALLKDSAQQENIDKTIVIASSALAQAKLKKELELIKQKQEEEKQNHLKEEEEKRKAKELETLKKKENEVDFSATTKIINLNEALSKDELKKLEEEALRELKEHEELRNVDELMEKKVSGSKNSNKDPLKTDEETTLKNKKATKKTLSLTMVTIFIAILYYLNFENDSKDESIIPVNPNISYPQSKDTASEKIAEENLEKAKKSASKYTYPDKLMAANFYRASLEAQRDSKTLGLLILTYAELLPHIANIKKQTKTKSGEIIEESISNYREKAGNVIFKLIKEGQIKSLRDENMAIGTALFYAYYKKYSAAINTLNRFKYANEKGKMQLRFFITYFDVAIRAEKLGLAKKLNAMLEKQPDKPQALYITLANYAMLENNYELAEKLLIEANKKYPDSVALLLEYSKILLYKEDYITLKKILIIIQELKAEYSGVFYAKYLEYSGILATTQKNTKVAMALFNMALSLNESVELRSRLSSLETSKNDKNANSLILDSKILGMLKKSKEAKAEYNWDKAFSYAIDASDLSESNITAKIFLSQLQSERGYFSEALTTLSELSSSHKLVREISFVLTKTYIDAYKFNDAKNVMSNLAQTDSRESTRYLSVMGYLYYKSGKYLDAIKWLTDSITKDPLNDKDYYYLALIYYKLNKFDRAKEMLSKMMDLDPANIDYKILYAKIIYEMESSDAAIGYLSTIIKDNESKVSDEDELMDEDKAKLYGEIAIYYHRSGQFKQFTEYKERLEKFQKQSKGLYEFLVQVAKLEDKEKDIIENSRKLLIIDPGNLEMRMFLGQYLLQIGKLDEALNTFSEVQQRLESYPKVLYYISRIYLLKGNMEEAKKYAKLEISFNPDTEFGYLLQGDIYIKEENYVEALNSYKKAQGINQSCSEALVGLAQISFAKGSYESSLELYLKAAKVSPNDAELRKKIGQVYKLLGQGMLAIEAFKIYLELAPDAKDKAEIQHAIKQLE
ncbi:MAG: tetratricopeptide repeat protein [Oligoflexia bacterium]|nr:tetratricopeptide repeat protein [Oligoflexia bacterium]